MHDDPADQNEQQRLAFLESLSILDTDREEVFDQVVRICAGTCGTPMAIISLVDKDRQWIKATIGFEIIETIRSAAFCNHTIRGKAPFIVEDAAAHPDFRNNPLVCGPPRLRFYAGCPLIFSQGYAAGALAVMDVVPRTLEPSQLSFLTLLAQHVVALLEMRQQREDLRNAVNDRNRMYDRLLEQTQLLSEAEHIARLGSWEMDAASGALTCSHGMHALLEHTACSHPRHIDELLSVVHEEDRPLIAAAIAHTAKSGTAFAVDHRMALASGEIRQIRSHGGIARKKNGAGTVITCCVQDCTEEYRAQERRRLLDASIARISDTVMITEAGPLDEPGPRIVFVNDAFEALTGYRKEEVLGRSPRFMQGTKTNREQRDRIRQALASRASVAVELISYRKDGSEFWLEAMISPVINQSGKVTHFVAVLRDITQRKATEGEIERLAFYDQLTGLPNRRLLMDRLQHELEHVRRTGIYGALMIIDLDHFKTLNDTLGHDMGDLLLQQVARRLEGVVRRSNTVARLGGDEFVVMLENLGKEQMKAVSYAETVAEKILLVFGHNFHLAGAEYRCTPSIGITLFHAHLTDATILFKRADIAMYQAKTLGRNRARFFDPQMQADVDARNKLEHDLRTALARQEFELYYQPQANMEGRVIGAEALLRWNRPRHGIVEPDFFLPLAEETGFIAQLGQWVLLHACRRLQSWSEDPRTAHLSLSVNISPVQFRHPDFVSQVMQIIENTGASPHKLKLEVTESALIERLEDTVLKMKHLKERGIHFSLDDFGTGYSSLSHLRSLPIDQMKIDQTFVAGIENNEHQAAITGTIITLGKILGLDVIAEGVETARQRDALAARGCQTYQGYLFSAPVSSSQFLA